MLDSGIIKICSLEKVNEQGKMPRFILVEKCSVFYEERTIGVTRLYAALGANQKLDIVARVWENRETLVDDIAVLEDGNQYRITAIQHLLNDDGLRVSDLTLERLDSLYDVD